jgi:hypothetical protein
MKVISRRCLQREYTASGGKAMDELEWIWKDPVVE